MNRKIPYETIAQKLENLPVPDMDVSWQKMKVLLDKEMPAAPGKKPGTGKWWAGGLALLLIGTAVVFYMRSPEAGDGNNEIATTEAVPGNLVTFPETSGQPGKRATASPEIPRMQNKETLKNDPQKTLNTGINSVPIAVSNTDIEPRSIDAIAKSSQKQTGKNNLKSRNVENILPLTPPVPLPAEAGNTSISSLLEVDSAVSDLNSSEISEKAIPNDKTSYFSYSASATALAKAMPASVPVENFLYTDRLTITAEGSLPKLTYQLPENESLKKAVARELKRQQRKDERDMARSYRSNRSLWGEQPERWFAAGLAPYQNFSIGDQKTYDYGAGATRNKVTDYIPAPYLQLHVTDRIYVLSEFQFNAPQATPNLLLNHRTFLTPVSSNVMYENTYLRKLYYFNMPLSFYYSPVKNFYLGSGMQFSSLSSGLASVEQMGPNNTLLRSETITLKDDAASYNFRGSEWRYLFDANYYVNRFMFGFRYSQAFNNYIDLKINNTLPASQARNQAFQLYFRYNIIVSDKRR